MADMELVIKVPEELYKAYKGRQPMLGDAGMDMIAQAIANGTPLPKGHGRLIDADNTISKICGSSCGCHFEECGHDEPCFSVTRIGSAPTIIEADNAESENK